MEDDLDAPLYVSRQGGYDYEFVLPLDPKYECGICLLALRSPHQTVCGHRFCRDCLANCISGRSVCPIDNRALGPSEVFPDACIEREVLELEVLCPGHCHGCKRRVSIRNLPAHLQACHYQVVLCPNQCASTVLQGELQQHMMETCALRPTKCGLCQAVYIFDKEQLHRAVCGDVEISCEACGEMCRRATLTIHLTTSCPETVVSCHYAEFGCSIKCRRCEMAQHMQDDTQQHLQLVSSAYKKMNTFVCELSRTVGLIQSPSFSRQPSLRSQLSATSPIHETGSDDQHPDKPRDTGEVLEAGGARSKTGDMKKETIAAEAQRHQLHLSNLNTEGGGGGSNNVSNKLSSNERILREVSDKTVDLSQRVLEETIRLDNLTKQVEDMELCLNSKIALIHGRLCDGDFLWRLDNFRHRCSDIKNKNLSTYSPPFYTSQLGYRCCVRLDVKWREEQYFLSLYLLLMKGENDDILDWPFQGRITLALLDQSSNCPKKHIVDTLDSNPELQAFQRPTGFRNEKSFGFTQFYPLNALLGKNSDGEEGCSCYLVRDVLCVRARVVPRGTFGADASESIDGISHNGSMDSTPVTAVRSNCRNKSIT